MAAFSNAHHLVFNNVQFADNSQQPNTSSGIRILLDASYPDASHDSSARYPPSRCSPGSREQHIQEIMDWALNQPDNDVPSILWFKGSPGVGKSSLAQTCAEKMEGILGAAFFFSRSRGWDDPGRLFTSLVYQFSTKSSAYRQLLDKKIGEDVTLVSKAIAYQFQRLIAQPLQELSSQGKGMAELVVIIDGLDECNSITAQCDIIEIIASSVQERTTPFRWAFFSRTEPHIDEVLSRSHIATFCRQMILSALPDKAISYGPSFPVNIIRSPEYYAPSTPSYIPQRPALVHNYSAPSQSSSHRTPVGNPTAYVGFDPFPSSRFLPTRTQGQWTNDDLSSDILSPLIIPTVPKPPSRSNLRRRSSISSIAVPLDSIPETLPSSDQSSSHSIGTGQGRRIPSHEPLSSPHSYNHHRSRSSSHSNSRTDSHANSLPHSRHSSRPGSRPSSLHNSRSNSRHSSRPNSRPGSRPGSRHGSIYTPPYSRPHSRDSSPGLPPSCLPAHSPQTSNSFDSALISALHTLVVNQSTPVSPPADISPGPFRTAWNSPPASSGTQAAPGNTTYQRDSYKLPPILPTPTWAAQQQQQQWHNPYKRQPRVRSAELPAISLPENQADLLPEELED